MSPRPKPPSIPLNTQDAAGQGRGEGKGEGVGTEGPGQDEAGEGAANPNDAPVVAGESGLENLNVGVEGDHDESRPAVKIND